MPKASQKSGIQFAVISSYHVSKIASYYLHSVFLSLPLSKFETLMLPGDYCTRMLWMISNKVEAARLIRKKSQIRLQSVTTSGSQKDHISC